jgi:hypothetical protein
MFSWIIYIFVFGVNINMKTFWEFVQDLRFSRWLEVTQGWDLYHGSKSEQMVGKFRSNERDAGWFGTGFYLTAYPDYARRWGKHIYRMTVPMGKFAEVQVIGNYKKIDFGDAEFANQEAGGTEGWIADEMSWAEKFTNALKMSGFDGVRVHFDQNKDVEVLIFDPSQVTLGSMINTN